MKNHGRWIPVLQNSYRHYLGRTWSERQWNHKTSLCQFRSRTQRWRVPGELRREFHSLVGAARTLLPIFEVWKQIVRCGLSHNRWWCPELSHLWAIVKAPAIYSPSSSSWKRPRIASETRTTHPASRIPHHYYYQLLSPSGFPPIAQRLASFLA